MIVETLIIGALQVNTYLLICEKSKECAVIDPGGDEEKIWLKLTQHEVQLKYIINTHGHLDHIIGNTYLKERSHAKIIIHQDDAEMLINPHPSILSMMYGNYFPVPPDIKVKEGDKIKIGQVELEVIHTPGHTLGGICLLTDGLIFTGDTLFAGGIGRTDFPGGSYPTLISSIKDKLFPLDNKLKIYPGHGPASDLQTEIDHNPFLK